MSRPNPLPPQCLTCCAQPAACLPWVFACFSFPSFASPLQCHLPRGAVCNHSIYILSIIHQHSLSHFSVVFFFFSLSLPFLEVIIFAIFALDLSKVKNIDEGPLVHVSPVSFPFSLYQRKPTLASLTSHVLLLTFLYFYYILLLVSH